MATLLTRNVALGVACLVTWLLVDHGRAAVRSLSATDDRLGAMWAVIAAIFVFKATTDASAAAVQARMAATAAAFVLCLAYLALFPFGAVGLAATIAVSGLVMALLGRPQDAGLAAI